ncbi:hypothetical protein Anapl_16950 [Anas platyrhynchos]|uniref:Uncharacterized protein n=1 Tax=Anas platyrhynchos TaxID=8839 RepID=R0LQJ4_ANAPL|nr:hypothetical protein Anapl_16950 [Anas platyrhynchos]
MNSSKKLLWEHGLPVRSEAIPSDHSTQLLVLNVHHVLQTIWLEEISMKIMIVPKVACRASCRDKVGLSEAFPMLSPKENMTVSVAATEPPPDFSSSSLQSILQKAFKAPEVKDFKWRG